MSKKKQMNKEFFFLKSILKKIKYFPELKNKTDVLIVNVSDLSSSKINYLTFCSNF